QRRGPFDARVRVLSERNDMRLEQRVMFIAIDVQAARPDRLIIWRGIDRESRLTRPRRRRFVRAARAHHPRSFCRPLEFLERGYDRFVLNEYQIPKARYELANERVGFRNAETRLRSELQLQDA